MQLEGSGARLRGGMEALKGKGEKKFLVIHFLRLTQIVFFHALVMT